MPSFRLVNLGYFSANENEFKEAVKHCRGLVKLSEHNKLWTQAMQRIIRNFDVEWTQNVEEGLAVEDWTLSRKPNPPPFFPEQLLPVPAGVHINSAEGMFVRDCAPHSNKIYSRLRSHALKADSEMMKKSMIKI